MGGIEGRRGYDAPLIRGRARSRRSQQVGKTFPARNMVRHRKESQKKLKNIDIPPTVDLIYRHIIGKVGFNKCVKLVSIFTPGKQVYNYH